MNKLYDTIPFPLKHGNCGGSLVQFQPGEEAENALPFEIGKVLVSWDMQPSDVRGNHAHYETEEIVVALSGGCTFDLDDGKGNKAQVRLSDEGCYPLPPNDSSSQPPHPASRIPHRKTKECILLFPHIWRAFYDFEPNTMLLVVANMKYDEADYIRDRAEFERLAQGWE